MSIEEYVQAAMAPSRAARAQFSEQHWFRAHMAAYLSPRDGFEYAIVRSLEALAHSAGAHAAAYQVPIGQDPVMGGEAWLLQARGLIHSLTGERGRLDAALIERGVRNLARVAGFGPEEL